jgi:hypothetical protein
VGQERRGARLHHRRCRLLGVIGGGGGSAKESIPKEIYSSEASQPAHICLLIVCSALLCSARWKYIPLSEEENRDHCEHSGHLFRSGFDAPPSKPSSRSYHLLIAHARQ